MFYIIVFIGCVGSIFVYNNYNIKNIGFKMIQAYTYISDIYANYFLNNTLTLKYYNVDARKEIQKSDCLESSLIEIKTHGVTRYLWGINRELLNVNSFLHSKKKLLSSVEVIIGDEKIDATDIINQFIHNGITLHLDIIMIDALLFILKKNIETENKIIEWNVITHTLDFLKGPELHFDIDTEYNLLLIKNNI